MIAAEGQVVARSVAVTPRGTRCSPRSRSRCTVHPRCLSSWRRRPGRTGVAAAAVAFVVAVTPRGTRCRPRSRSRCTVLPRCLSSWRTRLDRTGVAAAAVAFVVAVTPRGTRCRRRSRSRCTAHPRDGSSGHRSFHTSRAVTAIATARAVRRMVSALQRRDGSEMLSKFYYNCITNFYRLFCRFDRSLHGSCTFSLLGD